MKRLFVTLCLLLSISLLYSVETREKGEIQDCSLQELICKKAAEDLGSYPIDRLLELPEHLQRQVVREWFKNAESTKNVTFQFNWKSEQTFIWHNAYSSVSLSADGSRLASGSTDGTIKIRTLNQSNINRGPAVVLDESFEGHTQSIWSVSLSANGNRLASGSSDGIRIWDLNELGLPLEGKPAAILDKTTGGHTQSVWSVSLSANGEILASGSSDGTVKIWKLGENGVPEGEAPVATLGNPVEDLTQCVHSVSLSADAKRLASGYINGVIRIWNLNEDGTPKGEISVTLDESVGGHTQSVKSVSLSANGNRLASGSFGATVKVWNLDTEGYPLNGGPAATLDESVGGHTSIVKSVSLSADGKGLTSGSPDGTIKIWKLTQEGQLVGNGPAKTIDVSDRGHAPSVCSVSLSAYGELLAFGFTYGTASTNEAQEAVGLVLLQDSLTLPAIYVIEKENLTEDEIRILKSVFQNKPVDYLDRLKNNIRNVITESKKSVQKDSTRYNALEYFIRWIRSIFLTVE